MIVKTELIRVANIWLSLICEIKKKKTDKDIFASVCDRIWLRQSITINIYHTKVITLFFSFLNVVLIFLDYPLNEILIVFFNETHDWIKINTLVHLIYHDHNILSYSKFVLKTIASKAMVF